MGKKYYGVKVGRKVGVYNTWDECKKNVDGYPNAIYKAFSIKAEALNFVYDNKKSNTDTVSSELVAYIDGSYDDSLKRYSYGVIMFYKGEKYSYSSSSSDNELIELRNVAGELKAAIYVMNYAYKNKISTVDIYYDYLGIEMWATGGWKAKLPFTSEYAKYAQKIMGIIKINFIKVKSHSGNKYNEEVDKLAREALLVENKAGTVQEVTSPLEKEAVSKEQVNMYQEIFSDIKGNKSDLAIGNILRHKKLVTSDEVLKIFKERWKRNKHLLKDIKNLKAYYDSDNDEFVIFVELENGVEYMIIKGEDING